MNRPILNLVNISLSSLSRLIAYILGAVMPQWKYQIEEDRIPNVEGIQYKGKKNNHQQPLLRRPINQTSILLTGISAG